MSERVHEQASREAGSLPADSISHRLFLLGEATTYDALAEGYEQKADIMRATAEDYRRRAGERSASTTIKAPDRTEASVDLPTLGTDIIG